MIKVYDDSGRYLRTYKSINLLKVDDDVCFVVYFYKTKNGKHWAFVYNLEEETASKLSEECPHLNIDIQHDTDIVQDIRRWLLYP